MTVFRRNLLQDCCHDSAKSLCFESHFKNHCKRASPFQRLLGEEEALCQALAVPQNSWQFHPPFVLTFSNTWKNKRGPLIMGNPSRLQQGFSGSAPFWVCGETLQGPITCMQKERDETDGWRRRKTDMKQKDRERERERDAEGERQRHETERLRVREREGEQISWVLCLGGFQQPNKRTNTKRRRIFTSNPVLHPGSLSQQNKHPHAQHSEKEGHAQPLYTLKK